MREALRIWRNDMATKWKHALMRGELVNAFVRDKMQRDKKLTKNSINMVMYLLTSNAGSPNLTFFWGIWAELNWTFSYSSPLWCVVQNYFSLNDSFFLLIIYLHHSSYDLQSSHIKEITQFLIYSWKLKNLSIFKKKCKYNNHFVFSYMYF